LEIGIANREMLVYNSSKGAYFLAPTKSDILKNFIKEKSNEEIKIDQDHRDASCPVPALYGMW
jgi:hypothetical protein